MAYSPVEQGRPLGHPVLAEVARGHGITPARAAPAWVLRSGGVIAVPRAGPTAHVRDDAAALDVRLEPADLELPDEAFPPPRRRQPLEVL
jgi:diketogulonate reductase-like aldo/keto reductase